MPFVVGLTGGIGSGKSTVAGAFRALGAITIDTDDISRKLTAPSGNAIPALESYFGSQFIAADGGLDRAQVRLRIFADPDAKKALENILHPMIRSEVDAQIAVSNADYLLLEIPLLAESGAYRNRLMRIIVVDCEEETQIARTVSRSMLSRSEVKAIMASQVTRTERLNLANDIIENDAGLDALQRAVAVVNHRLRLLTQVSQ